MALGSVGPYRVLERLGAGANGEVCLAEDMRLQRRVALKTCSGTAGADASDLRRRLLREARAAARLNHPHIAAVYDVIESDDGVHIVMEYVRGTTLATRIRQGPYTPMQVVDIALQLAGALDHAHSFGVIHRDLKPANIIVSPDGATKILDFGLARLCEVDAGSVPLSASDLSVEGRHVVGTPPYIPPEHLGGAPVDARGDIYSLGVTLFEMLTGRRPFEASNGMGLSQAILNSPTPRARSLSPDMPEGLDAIVYRAMSRNPSDRYASAAELVSDLKRLSAGITDVPTQSKARPPAGTGNRRRYAWGAAAVAAAAVAVFSFGRSGFAGRTPSATASLAAGPKVVAVLPLAGAAGDSQNEALAAGVADTLITTLSKVPGLTVVSRSATLKYQDRKTETDAMARELGATMLVDGMLQRSGDRLRISLTVLEPGAKVALWQNDYDGTFGEVFTLQREVADAVAAALRLPDSKTAADDRPTRSVEAFADYAQARSFLERTDVKENLDRSIALFQSAIARDPRFARAHAGLGEAYWRKYQATREEKWSVDARDAINEALRLDPNDATVRLSLGILYRGMGRMKEAAEELTKVIAASPQSDEAHRQLGAVLVALGEPDRGITQMREAIGLRPNYLVHHQTLGTTYYNLGRFREAAESFQRIIDLQPDSALGYSMLGSTRHAMDDTAAAVKLYEKAKSLGNANAYGNLGMLHYGETRYQEAALNLAEAVKRDPGSPLQHLNLADAYKMLGQDAAGRAEYEQALTLSQAQVRVNPSDTRALARLAVIESKLDRAKDAAIHIEQAIAREPKNPDILFYQAIVRLRAGHLEDAVAALGEAFDNGYSRLRASKDPDLAPLQKHAGYRQVMARNEGGGAR